MTDIPILLIAFNRPENVKRVIESLALIKPKRLLFAVDGPRAGNASDQVKVANVQNAIANLNWTTSVETYFRKENLGIRRGIPDAVSWAISKYGKVIVLEDDAVPGPEFHAYMSARLNQFEHNEKIGHISGYNQVPKSSLTNPENMFRGSIYPESYAWGTWERAWKFYSDDINYNPRFQYRNHASEMVWESYFNLARKDYISTWAFRWVASLWRNEMTCISPNRNLIEYIGQTGGTHTFRKPRAGEQPIELLRHQTDTNDISVDKKADDWIAHTLFKENLIGVFDLKVSTQIYRILSHIPRQTNDRFTLDR